MATLLLTLLFLYYCSYANSTSIDATYAILIFFRQESRIFITDDISINDSLFQKSH